MKYLWLLWAYYCFSRESVWGRRAWFCYELEWKRLGDRCDCVSDVWGRRHYRAVCRQQERRP